MEDIIHHVSVKHGSRQGGPGAGDEWAKTWLAMGFWRLGRREEDGGKLDRLWAKQVVQGIGGAFRSPSPLKGEKPPPPPWWWWWLTTTGAAPAAEPAAAAPTGAAAELAKPPLGACFC